MYFFIFYQNKMTRTIKLLSVGVLVIILVVFIWAKLGQTKQTAGDYLDKIVELRQEKQSKILDIAYLDMKINQYKEKMNAIQYSWLDYMGLPQEAQSPQRTWGEITLTWNQ